MFFDKKGSRVQLNSHSLVAGFDLGEESSQISFFHLDEEEPQTLAVIAGTQQFSIPTVLCKRFEVNQWYFGREAAKYAQDGEGILVDHLVSRARTGEAVLIEEQEYDPVELLSLFVKRSFSMIGMASGTQEVSAAMLTLDGLDGRMAEVMTVVAKSLPVSNELTFFQSHEESAFHYIINQPEELWTREVVLFELSGEGLQTYRMELNRRTIPIVAFMPQLHYPDFVRNDEELLEISTALFHSKIINTVYLVGDDFTEEWWPKSQQFLCNHRRVFLGNNLFSKGAAYAIKEKLLQTERSKQYILLGRDKLKANLGMKVIKEGVESYFVLLNAGEKWYEAYKEFDLILEAGNTLSIQITSLNKEVREVAQIALSGLPMRPRKTSRIRMTVSMKNENIVKFHMIDMGFGEFYKSSGMEWTEELDLS